MWSWRNKNKFSNNNNNDKVYKCWWCQYVAVVLSSKLDHIVHCKFLYSVAMQNDFRLLRKMIAFVWCSMSRATLRQPIQSHLIHVIQWYFSFQSTFEYFLFFCYFGYNRRTHHGTHKNISMSWHAFGTQFPRHFRGKYKIFNSFKSITSSSSS